MKKLLKIGNDDEMKFLICGLGSMGKRRIRNLKQLNQEEIIGFDIRDDRCAEVNEKFGIKTFTEIKIALNEKPYVMIISTPPDLHMKYAKIALENNLHFFTEVNILQEEMDEIINQLKKTDLVGFPSCTMIFHPIIKKINEYLESGKIGKTLSFLYHSGMYLPDWHPWEDYREFYVSKRITGACREIVPFELLWIIKSFGEISSVTSKIAKISNLDADIDDIYNVLLEFENGIQGNLTVDVISRFPYRQLKILGEDGVITADWSERTVSYFTKDDGWVKEEISDGNIEKNYIHGDGPYVEEIKSFIKTIKERNNPKNTFENDHKILKILDAIEKSNELGITRTLEK